MNSRRPYRGALPKDAIIAELKKARGTQLDPKIVDIFFEIINSDSGIFDRKG